MAERIYDCATCPNYACKTKELNPSGKGMCPRQHKIVRRGRDPMKPLQEAGPGL